MIKNDLLCHILHIRNVDICGTEREIATKSLSAINNISAYELSSTTKLQMCGYKESLHSTYL